MKNSNNNTVKNTFDKFQNNAIGNKELKNVKGGFIGIDDVVIQ